MSRFETQFATLNAKNEGAFVPFVTLCDPTFDHSFEIICTLVDNGADALELGFPFSDPLLDGPVIQAANNRALTAGHSSEDSFKLLEKVRSKYPEIPISLLLCANLIFAKGLDAFYQRCAEVGNHQTPAVPENKHNPPGIAQPAQVKEALALGVAGAISGSATVKIIERNLDNHEQCLAELAEFVQTMKAATK
ncbi:tryptophan synthase subunit alpha [Haemophilus influenzae]